MAKRFYSTYKSTKNLTYNVEIWDTAFAGTATSFDIGEGGFRLRISGEGDEILNHISPTDCEFDYMLANATDFALVTDLTVAAEGRFTIKITKGTSSPTPFWYGQIVPDVGSYSEENYPQKFTIRATDGIGLLKTIDFKDTSAAYNGKERALAMIKNALKKLPYVSIHYGGSDNFIATVLDVRETTMTIGGTDPCALFQTYLDYSVWQTYDKGEEKYTSCYDVIKNILTTFGARITTRNGIFWIEQIHYRVETTVIVRTYTRDGGLSSADNYATINDINQTAGGALLAVGEYEFFPALRKATHIYEINTRRNFLESVKDMNESSSLYTIYKPIDKNGDKTTLRFTGTLGISINSEIPDPSFLTPFDPFALIFRVNLSIGTANLVREYTLDPSYQVIYDPMEWGATPGLYIAVPITNSAFLINTSDNIFTFTQDVDIMTPILTDSAENFSISLQLEGIGKFAGGTYSLSDFTIAFELTKPWLEAYSYGTPALTEDEREYFTINDVNTSNSATIEQTSIIGTSQDPNSLGALWVKPAADYVLATNWGLGADTPDRPIEYFLTELLVSGQYSPTRKIQGTFYGSIDALARYSWDGVYWLVLGGSWDADNDQFTGTLVELKYDQDFNASPPIKKKKLLVSTTIPPTLPASGQGGPVYDITAKPPATVIYSVALTTTDSALLSGAITSLPISETMVANDVLDGDTVVIVNPLTGDFEELTVTATAAGGETAIAVSGTLAVNYPANSPIVRRPRLGRFFLPEGTTGDILYYNGTAWVVLHIGTTGQVLSVSGGVPVWGSAGAGSVTSVALALPASVFSISGSPVNSSGTLTGTFVTQSANTVFAGPTTGGATTPAFRALVAADIPNLDAAKITTGTFAIARGGTGLSALGTALQYLRVNAGGTALEYATLSAGNITGTMTATRLQFAASSTALDDDANLTWDDTNKRLLIGTGVTQAFLNVFSGAITGTTEFLRMSGNINGNMIAYLLNANNASTNANAFLGISVGGSSAGDPFIQYIVSGVTTWAAGVDNSDSDAFKIANSSTVGTVGTDLLIIGTDGRVSLGGTALLALVDLTIDGTGGIRVPSGTSAQRPTITNTIIRNNTTFGGLEFKNPFGQWHRIYGSNPTGTITPGPGAGTSPTINAVGTDRAFKLNITTGSAPTLNGEILTINFGTSFDILPYIALTAYNAVTATDYNKFYIDFNSVGGFSIKANGTLTAFTTYVLSVVVQQ